jgi:hypothetical protein
MEIIDLVLMAVRGHKKAITVTVNRPIDRE